MTGRAAAIALALCLVLSAARGHAQPASTDAGTRFDAALALLGTAPEAAVTALVVLADDPVAVTLAPDALFAAARAVEERLHDPARARALYQTLLARYPDTRAALGASRRERALTSELGASPASATAAAAFARLQAVGRAQLTPAQLAEADQLAQAPWPGAPEVSLWLADVAQRRGDIVGARARLLPLRASTVGTPWRVEVLRSSAALAILAHDWTDAEALALALPRETAADRALLDELRGEIAQGRKRGGLVLAAVVVALVGLLALLASLVHAVGNRRALVRALRPPLDVWYVGPVLAVVALAAATGFAGIGRAVLWIAGAGTVVAWLSGAGLDAARRRGERRRVRVLMHAVLAPVVVLAVVVAVLMHDQLADLVVATLQDGPDS